MNDMSEPASKKVSFDYIKSNLFRMIYADGFFGGLTPSRKLFVSVYNERFPIPRTVVYKLEEGGTLGEEIASERQGRRSIVRDVEVGIEMDLKVAESLVDWLQDKIAEAKIAEAQRLSKDNSTQEAQ
ncbi:MAG TPA: hypothetical protein VML01_06150 [Bryobacterales bacterium]|nr:hypothetical protein [Bryobacterales bacterium]